MTRQPVHARIELAVGEGDLVGHYCDRVGGPLDLRVEQVREGPLRRGAVPGGEQFRAFGGLEHVDGRDSAFGLVHHGPQDAFEALGHRRDGGGIEQGCRVGEFCDHTGDVATSS